MYQFYYLAVNEQGKGEPSLITTIQASSKPEPSAPVRLSNQGKNVLVEWNLTPDDHGNSV